MQNCPRNVYASALSSRKFADGSVQQIFKIEQGSEFRKPFLEFFARYTVQRRTALQIVPDRKCFVKYGVLEHNAKFSAYLFRAFLHVFTADEHRSRIFCKLTAENRNRR